jgi:hypothetical protein
MVCVVTNRNSTVRFLFVKSLTTTGAVAIAPPAGRYREPDKEDAMATCKVCGNEYARTMTIEKDGSSHVFDSFECAIHALAPTCEHCDCRIIGHGVEAGNRIFCCAQCARHEGVEGLADAA